MGHRAPVQTSRGEVRGRASQRRGPERRSRPHGARAAPTGTSTTVKGGYTRGRIAKVTRQWPRTPEAWAGGCPAMRLQTDGEREEAWAPSARSRARGPEAPRGRGSGSGRAGETTGGSGFGRDNEQPAAVTHGDEARGGAQCKGRTRAVCRADGEAGGRNGPQRERVRGLDRRPREGGV